MNVLAPIVAALLTAIAALHVYWGAGGVWPGRDGESLALTVVGGPIGSRMPSAFACHAVAVVLVAAAPLALTLAAMTFGSLL